MAVTIAITSSKGGVGKTTCTINLAAALAELGEKSLIIDGDWQGQSTAAVDLQYNTEKSIYSVLTAGVPLVEAIQTNGMVYLVGGDERMAMLDEALSTRLMRESLLQRAIKPVLPRFKFILIDCPPQYGIFNINAILASQYFLIPMFAESLAVHGLDLFIAKTKALLVETGSSARMLGVCLTKYNDRLRSARKAKKLVEELVSKQHVLNSVISDNVTFTESQGESLDVFAYQGEFKDQVARIEKARQQYRQLTREIINLLSQ